MSGSTAIRVENLSKQYRLGNIGGTTLREDLGRWWARKRGRPDPWAKIGTSAEANENGTDFWALRDISFEIREGEVLGVIGRNGAGKSTLLKILSRITSPTNGRATIHGRVGSLLEVGTGFHPELTGRENVYLNGAILGMKRAEITQKLSEIVDFAEMSRFIDTPVKRYSSGMTVRLAFAVAAHLEPEILIVDEVLAVGDTQFQKKCIGRMNELSNEGRTVVFVSHQLGVMTQLCTKGLYLQAGKVHTFGDISQAVNDYMSLGDSPSARTEFESIVGRPSISSVEICVESALRGDLIAKIGFRSPFELNRPIGGVIIYDRHGAPVWGSNGRFHPRCGELAPMREGFLTCTAKQLPLAQSNYTASFWLADWYEDLDSKERVVNFEFGNEADVLPGPPLEVIGYTNWKAEWSARCS
jgi:lipopolysaccharide transport system ATP-binding protein